MEEILLMKRNHYATLQKTLPLLQAVKSPKKLRKIFPRDYPKFGCGSFGTIRRIDRETIVKIYYSNLSFIERIAEDEILGSLEIPLGLQILEVVKTPRSIGLIKPFLEEIPSDLLDEFEERNSEFLDGYWDYGVEQYGTDREGNFYRLDTQTELLSENYIDLATPLGWKRKIQNRTKDLVLGMKNKRFTPGDLVIFRNKSTWASKKLGRGPHSIRATRDTAQFQLIRIDKADGTESYWVQSFKVKAWEEIQ